jgi:hypothetical protein
MGAAGQSGQQDLGSSWAGNSATGMSNGPTVGVPQTATNYGGTPGNVQYGQYAPLPMSSPQTALPSQLNTNASMPSPDFIAQQAAARNATPAPSPAAPNPLTGGFIQQSTDPGTGTNPLVGGFIQQSQDPGYGLNPAAPAAPTSQQAAITNLQNLWNQRQVYS